MNPSAVTCPLCQADRARPHYRENGFDYRRCPDCGLLFLWPRPSPDFLREHYQGYLQVAPAQVSAWGRDMAPVIAGAAATLEALRPERGRILDVGCGYGFFLEAMRRKGWIAEGVELSEPAAAIARRMTGLPVHSCALEETEFDGPFDVVTMFYVIEHVPDPVRTLRDAARLLKPGGLLLLRYPNTSPLLRVAPLARRLRLMQAPSHLHDFGRHSMRLLLDAAGFEHLRTSIEAGTSSDMLLKRLISGGASLLGGWLGRMTGDALLLPGVSRVTLAKSKPSMPPMPAEDSTSHTPTFDRSNAPMHKDSPYA